MSANLVGWESCSRLANYCEDLSAQASSDPVEKQRTALLKIKELICFNPMETDHYQQYIDTQLSLLKYEFSLFEKDFRPPYWNRLATILASEIQDGQTMSNDLNGCGHLPYIVAMQEFLTSKSYQDWLSGLVAKEKEVVSEVGNHLFDLLDSCAQVSALIGAMKAVPKSNEGKIPGLIKDVLQENILVHFKETHELLFPLGYLMHEPIGGHFVLCRLLHPSHSKKGVDIEIYNPTSTLSQRVEAAASQQFEVQTALTMHSERELDAVLKDTYSLLTLQLPDVLSGRVKSIPSPYKGFTDLPSRIHQITSEILYGLLGKGSVPIVEGSGSSLNNCTLVKGKHCVPSAFRMLLYRLIKECGEAHGIVPSKHEKLKALGDQLLIEFSQFVNRTSVG